MELPPLAGFTVAVTADRRREEQAELFGRRGADVVLAPTIVTRPLLDDERLRAAIDDLIARPPDVTVLQTGIGVRGMVTAAECMALDGALLGSLRTSTVVARGPKAASIGAQFGLEVAWHPPTQRGSEIVEHLTERARSGCRVAVQRDGNRTAEIADALAERGADVVDIPVYRWDLPDDPAPALRLVQQLAAASVDAVTFTSAPALRNLMVIADGEGRRADVLAAFAQRTAAVCVGPVCADAARDEGIDRFVVPTRSRIGPMVEAVVQELQGRCTRFTAASAEVFLRGAIAVVDGAQVRLTDRERAVLDILVDARGSVVAKPQLLRDVWRSDDADEHAVEVTVSRLRRRLGPAGEAVCTVPRRGYRLDVA